MNADQIHAALADWGQRIGIEAVARITADRPETAEFPDLHDVAAASAVTGAALTLECLGRIDAMSDEIIERLVRDTP